ncbi:hypothetical protein RJ639_013705, partial [Escallonia herrerae]
MAVPSATAEKIEQPQMADQPPPPRLSDASAVSPEPPSSSPPPPSGADPPDHTATTDQANSTPSPSRQPEIQVLYHHCNVNLCGYDIANNVALRVYLAHVFYLLLVVYALLSLERISGSTCAKLGIPAPPRTIARFQWNVSDPPSPLRMAPTIGLVGEKPSATLWTSSAPPLRRSKYEAGVRVARIDALPSQSQNNPRYRRRVDDVRGGRQRERGEGREYHVLIEDFNCALQENFLFQGHMYLFVHYICFYGNIFGFEAKKVIPFQEVTSVRRAKAAVLFPTAIEVIAAGKKYFFTSFLSRDEAFKLINDGWLQHGNEVKVNLDEQVLKEVKAITDPQVADVSIVAALTQSFGCRVGCFPLTYLGLPLGASFKGKFVGTRSAGDGAVRLQSYKLPLMLDLVGLGVVTQVNDVTELHQGSSSESNSQENGMVIVERAESFRQPVDELDLAERNKDASASGPVGEAEVVSTSSGRQVNVDGDTEVALNSECSSSGNSLVWEAEDSDAPE